jgi:hypothetical protein
MRIAFFAFLALSACEKSAVVVGDDSGVPDPDADADTDADSDADTDADSDADTDADSDADADADTGPLPDLTEEMDTSAAVCSTYYTEERAGAKGYWWAEYHGSRTDGWEGEVHWVLFANDTWKAEGGADCETVWYATATAAEPTYCADCDLGMLTSTMVNRPATTCPESVYFNYQNLNYPYDIRLRDGGYSDWYYYNYSAGNGYWLGDDVTDLSYLSAAACVWF